MEHHPAFRKLFKGWRTCRYFGRNLGKLNEGSKTVQDGGLWYEEALPTETILSGIVLATPVSKSGMDSEAVFSELSKLMDKTLQLGGKATVGQGMCRVLLGKESV